MGKKLVAVLGSFVAGSALCVAPSAGAAGFEVGASVDELASIQDNGYYGAANIELSQDLSTAAYFEFDDQTGSPGPLYVVDVVADTRREITLPRSSTGFERLVALDGDGSTALIVADWEGVAADDADGGLADAFLLDTRTGDLELLTGALDDVSVFGLSMDDAGTTILLSVYRSDTEGSLYLVENGVLEELTGLASGSFENTYVAQLSGDGSSLLYASRIGFQNRWHVRDLQTGDESVIAAPDGRPEMSSDGSVVVSLLPGGEMSSTLATWDTSTAILRTSTVDGSGQDFELSSDGTTIMAAGFSEVGSNDYRTEIATIDLASGERTVLWSSSSEDLQLIGANGDLDRIVIRSRFAIVPVIPVPVEAVYGGYGETEATYLVDFKAEPTELPLPGRVGSLDDQMTRLYEAYFDRAPDSEGLAFWRDQRAAGRGLASVSGEFARSPEFVETYGALDDEAFVDLVYRNVLDRDPDDGGRMFWLDQLANGRTRGSLMTLFSESPEFIATTSTQAAPLPIEAAVGRLYSALFGRQPDAAGLAYWVSEANRGVPLDDIAWYFMRTEEFQNLYGDFAGDPYAILFVVYRNGMNRDLDLEGERLSDQHYLEGRPIEELIVEVTNSAEFVSLTSTTPPNG